MVTCGSTNCPLIGAVTSLPGAADRELAARSRRVLDLGSAVLFLALKSKQEFCRRRLAKQQLTCYSLDLPVPLCACSVLIRSCPHCFSPARAQGASRRAGSSLISRSGRKSCPKAELQFGRLQNEQGPCAGLAGLWQSPGLTGRLSGSRCSPVLTNPCQQGHLGSERSPNPLVFFYPVTATSPQGEGERALSLS